MQEDFASRDEAVTARGARTYQWTVTIEAGGSMHRLGPPTVMRKTPA